MAGGWALGAAPLLAGENPPWHCPQLDACSLTSFFCVHPSYHRDVPWHKGESTDRALSRLDGIPSPRGAPEGFSAKRSLFRLSEPPKHLESHRRVEGAGAEAMWWRAEEEGDSTDNEAIAYDIDSRDVF